MVIFLIIAVMRKGNHIKDPALGNNFIIIVNLVLLNDQKKLNSN